MKPSMHRRLIRQINNMKIYYSPLLAPWYSVMSPDGRVLEEFTNLEKAEDWCKRKTDFISERSKK